MTQQITEPNASVNALTEPNAALKETILQLQETIKELQLRLKWNSQNSSKHPSGDGFIAPARENIAGDVYGMRNQSRNFYFEPKKIVRDLIHDYINLTDFELMIVDTVAFQRLKDVRQLTCQHVYPSARHTRFEHSLGVLELTRRAIKHLNKNGFLVKEQVKGRILDESLEFNACIAALLHDVGHCPYSHLGELEFDVDSINKDLLCEIKGCEFFDGKELASAIRKRKKIGAIHEQLSCIIILRIYGEMLSNLCVEPQDSMDACCIKTDFELIIRAILGIEYSLDTKSKSKSKTRKNRIKNIVVRLINSSVFDMDKLDYIMRDAMFTGIGVPAIDIKRLFKNMYLDQDYDLIFTSRAVPVLQNMIDSRDALYLYVYNHHAVVFSDFMNSYILRKLSHNARDYLNILYPGAGSREIADLEEGLLISSLGLVPKPYLFSSGAIIEGARSDSDWISLLNIIHTHHDDSREYICSVLNEEIERGKETCTHIRPVKRINKNKVEKLVDRIEDTYKLIHNLKTRRFLKPWWKTVFEFSSFINQHFPDDRVRGKLGKWICDGGKHGLKASEFRSQIAKHVIYITQKLFSTGKDWGLVEPLAGDEFFVIERSNRFFEISAIEQLQIALKTSEILGEPKAVIQKKGYFARKLTNIIPQKDYSSIYDKEGFYVFSKPLDKDVTDMLRRRHYEMIERIFTFVATEFINRGEQEFVAMFGSNGSTNNDNREGFFKKSCEDMLNRFMES